MKTGLIVGGIALAFALYAGWVWLVMTVWNATVVPTFDGPRLTFWITAGLLLILGVIGGAFRHSRS